MSNQEIKKHQNKKLDDQDVSTRSGAGAIKKTASFLSSASGIKSAKKNIGIIKHRASFPLLRRVLSNELKTTKSAPKFVDISELSESDCDRSYFWHTIIVAIAAPALIWSIFILTKALAIGIKFDVWSPSLNQGLYTAVPMIVFTGSKLYVSWHSRKWFKETSHLSRQDS